MPEQMTIEPKEFEVTKPESAAIIKTPMDLLTFAVQNNSAIDVIERLSALQEKAMAREAEMRFNDAMNAVQAEIPLIAPDLPLPHAGKKYGSYKALNKVVRPIYIKHGFSLSFNAGEAPVGFVKALCKVSHSGGHSRDYQSPNWPADGKGARGGDVMSASDATGGAMSRAKRHMLSFIFNIVVGEEDEAQDTQAVLDWISAMEEQETKEATLGKFKQAYAVFYKAGDWESIKRLDNAKKKIYKAKGWA